MLQVDPEREMIQALNHASQVRMAEHALAGWSFHACAANTWVAKRVGWFDQYGSSLSHCIAGVDAAIDRMAVGMVGGARDRR